MSQSPSVYSGMITAQSRRLRTIGAVLLVAVALMALYGSLVLMPRINRSVEVRRAAQARLEKNGAAPAGTPGIAAPAETPALARAQKAEKLQVATVFAYWGVCALLVIATLFVAWLDLREISRSYVQQRRQLWMQTANDMSREGVSGGEKSRPERN